MTLDAQTITLADGRTLGYAEWGDLTGSPVFFFGGSSSARYLRHPDDAILNEFGVHMFTFDRPGRGLSTRQPERRLLHWASDVRSFAAAKGIARFAVVGVSQGGPYATACAYALPDLLTGVALVSGVAGLENAGVMATQNRALRMQIAMARRVPGLLALQLGMMRPMLNGERAKGLMQRVLGNLPDSDKQALNAPGTLEMMIQDMREGMRQGGRGGADDMRAVVLDWGFKLEDIRVKVHIWQGLDDPNVTPAMAQYMADRIPNHELHLVPGVGHFLLYSHWRDILARLLDAEKLQNGARSEPR